MSGCFTLVILIVVVIISAIGRMAESERPQTPRYSPTPESVEEAPRRPLPQPRETKPDGTRVLPPPASSDPPAVFAEETRGTALGTGFSLDDHGTWMTARHVALGCSRIFVLTGPRVGLLVQSVYIHPGADLAVLRTHSGAPHVVFSPDQLRVGQTAYHFGFPMGEPGAVRSSLLGRANMRSQSRSAVSEPVVVWAERARVPEGAELGGMSGGPAFDESGRVIGVTVAASSRRGRVFTTDPSSVRAAVGSANVTPAAETSAAQPRLSARTWVEEGAVLRRTLSVAQIVCEVD